MVVALALAGGILVLCGCVRYAPSGQRTEAASAARLSDPAGYAARIVRETNDVRDARGLPELEGSRCAKEAASQRARRLIGSTKLTHAALAGVLSRCAPITTAAENLSRAVGSPTAVVGAWLGSPGHRSNLLDPALTEIGVGCVPDGKRMLCSQVFLGP